MSEPDFRKMGDPLNDRLPPNRRGTVSRSVDGGATWSELTVISEAWTDDTFHDATVPANVFTLYVAE